MWKTAKQFINNYVYKLKLNTIERSNVLILYTIAIILINANTILGIQDNHVMSINNNSSGADHMRELTKDNGTIPPVTNRNVTHSLKWHVNHERMLWQNKCLEYDWSIEKGW